MLSALATAQDLGTNESPCPLSAGGDSSGPGFHRVRHGYEPHHEEATAEAASARPARKAASPPPPGVG